MATTSVHTDLQLFSRIAEGDEAAFEIMFDKYVVEVSRIIFRIVRSETLTKDIVQEVFMQLWLGRHKLPEVEDPSLWIYRITYNCSYQHIRKQLLYDRTAANMKTGQDSSAYNYETQETLDFAETSRLIQHAIGQLPAQARRIYQLNRLHGMKAQEIADELTISVQSVRNSLTRSAKVIKDYLAQHGIIIPLLLLLLITPDFF